MNLLSMTAQQNQAQAAAALEKRAAFDQTDAAAHQAAQARVAKRKDCFSPGGYFYPC